MIKLIRATLIGVCLTIVAEITQRYFNTNATVPFLFGWYACLIINWEKIIK
jgi:hypothetical protein